MLSVKSLHRSGLGPVDLRVETGDILAISGPSGAGKSLLLRAIADLDKNTGEVCTHKLDRAKTGGPEWRKHVAMLPAETGWWEETVAAHFRHPENTRYLGALGLPDEAMHWQVENLSSGERHRLAFARCLENDADVLLLDEPTAALDLANTEMLETLLKQLLTQGKTILIVTHDPDQAARLGARTALLEHGKLGPAL